MHCFCLSQTKISVTDILDNLMVSFKDVEGAEEDGTLYCKRWAINYGAQQALIIGTSVVVLAINAIICLIFEMISKYEKHHTENDLTLA